MRLLKTHFHTSERQGNEAGKVRYKKMKGRRRLKGQEVIVEGCRRGLRGRRELRLPRPEHNFPRQGSSAGYPGGHSTKIRRVVEAGTSAESLPLAATTTSAAPVPTAAPGSGTSDQQLSSAIAVDARTRRPGDLEGSAAYMAAEPNPCFPPEAANMVVNVVGACSIEGEYGLEDLGVRVGLRALADGGHRIVHLRPAANVKFGG